MKDKKIQPILILRFRGTVAQFRKALEFEKRLTDEKDIIVFISEDENSPIKA